jgi:copper transport protein
VSPERATARRAAVVVATGLVALAFPLAAWAHAYVVSTRPVSGAVVTSSPGRVTVVYDEPVTISAGALAVYAANGKHVDSGKVLQPVGDTIAVAIPRRLPHGTYTVAWRVTSADTHVVHGAFTFSVGVPGKTGGIVAKLLASQEIPASVTFPFAVVRFLNFLLILAGCGGALAFVLVLRDADPSVRRKLARVLVACGGLLALGATAGLPFEAAESTGSGLGGGFGAAALADVRGLRFGEVWLARAWLALLFALLALSLEHGPTRWRHTREAALLAVGVALLLTPSAAGHADVGGTLTFAADAAHVAAAAAWTGGLAFVVVALALSPTESRWALAARSVPRFSSLALGAVALLLVAGVTNAYLEVRAWRGLWQSTYGELVLTKAALVLPLLALGAFNNRISVPRLRADPGSRIVQRRFLQAVAAELTLFVAIVAVTAVLVDERPFEDQLARAGPAASTTTTRVGPFTGSVDVTPAAVGPNRIDLSFTTGKGDPAVLAEVDVAASLPSRKIGPLRFTARRLARGHFQVAAAQLPIPGEWRLRLTVRQGQFDEWLKTIPIQIRKEPGA